jgi:competence protein ComEC
MHLSYYRRPLFILLALYAAGIWLFRDRVLRPPAGLPFGLPRSGALVTGRVAEYPAAVPGGVRFALDTKSVYGAPLKTGLMVYTPAMNGAGYGDTISFLADLEAPPGAAVPGALDWADYLSRRGIAAQARARDVSVERPANPALRLARRIRAAALGAFYSALPPEQAAVFGGIVLGEKRGVPPDLKDAFRDSGAMHLLVASGSNVGFVVAVVYFLCGRLGLRRRPAGLAALGASGLYVLAAGLDAPLVRAYLMFGAGLSAFLLRREAGAFHALCAAALLILLFSPRSLFDAGFQMSFLAAYGLTAGLSAWAPYLGRPGPAGWALGLFSVSVFAQLCLFPVLAIYFHRVSLVSLVSNMALVPAAAAAMALGFLLAALQWAGPLFKALAWAAGLFMKLLLWAVKFFAALPFASISVPEPSPLLAAGALLLALALLHAPLLGFGRPRFYAAALAGLALMGLSPLTAARPGAAPAGALLFGDSNTSSALLRGPSGGLYLVNPGINGAKLADAVLGAGAASLEAVLLTSPEKKNYSGLEELSSRVKVKAVLLPYGPRPGPLRELLARLQQGGAAVERLWPGESAAGAACGWEGSAGYTGRADRFGWRVGGIAVSGEGAIAELEAPSGRAAAAAEKGRVVRLGGL